jgi:hypothetical protein
MGDKVAQVPKFPRLQERNVRTGYFDDADYSKLAQACSKEGFWMRSLFETGHGAGGVFLSCSGCESGSLTC